MFWFNRKKEINEMLNRIVLYISKEEFIAKLNDFLNDFDGDLISYYRFDTNKK